MLSFASCPSLSFCSIGCFAWAGLLDHSYVVMHEWWLARNGMLDRSLLGQRQHPVRVSSIVGTSVRSSDIGFLCGIPIARAFIRLHRLSLSPRAAAPSGHAARGGPYSVRRVSRPVCLLNGLWVDEPRRNARYLGCGKSRGYGALGLAAPQTSVLAYDRRIGLPSFSFGSDGAVPTSLMMLPG